MKKIMFISNQLGGGGAERVLTLIANRMELDNNQVILYALNAINNKYQINENIVVKELDCKNSTTLDVVRLLRKEIKKQKPNVIISFEYHVNIKVLIATRYLKGLKIIVSERNDPAQQKDRKLVNFLRDYLYRKADVLVCQTPDAKAYFSKKVQKHAVIIPNPIKSGLPLYHGQSSKTIINFCRLEKQKNLPLLIEAFEQLHDQDNDVKLEIYGDGKERDALLQLVKNKHLEESVSINPATINIHEIAAGCKMFVSSSNYEGLSNSMLEAMAMGMPTICTDCPCGGARMVIENEKNGLLVPVGDKQALVEAMKRVFSNEELATTLSVNAIKIKDELTQEKIAGEWYGLL